MRGTLNELALPSSELPLLIDLEVRRCHWIYRDDRSKTLLLPMRFVPCAQSWSRDAVAETFYWSVPFGLIANRDRICQALLFGCPPPHHASKTRHWPKDKDGRIVTYFPIDYNYPSAYIDSLPVFFVDDCGLLEFNRARRTSSQFSVSKRREHSHNMFYKVIYLYCLVQ